MKHEITTIEIDGVNHDFITLFIDEGVARTFPADQSNPDYVAWLETEDGKAYLASQKANK